MGGDSPHSLKVMNINEIKVIITFPFGRKMQERKADFFWNERHGCYIHQGKEYSIDEYNELMPKVLDKYHDYADPRHPSPLQPRAIVVKPPDARKEALRKVRERVALEGQKGLTTSDAKGSPG